MSRATSGAARWRVSRAALRIALGSAPLLGLAASGCYSVPPGRSSVDSVEVRQVRGKEGPDTGEIADKLATTASPKFLGLFRGVVYEYALLERSVLQKDLARVEATCRARGYYEAHVRAGRVHAMSNGHVRVEILIDPGEPVRVAATRVDGAAQLPAELSRRLEEAIAANVPPGALFAEDAYDAARVALARTLTDAGYAFAQVTSAANVDLVGHRAFLRYQVAAGTPQTFGEVRVEGAEDLPVSKVLGALAIEPGAPYSTRALDTGRQAVLDLGVFASVEVAPALERGPQPDGRVALVVKVEPSKLHTVRVGGGVEFDALKTAVTAQAGWESRNFLGGMRLFRVDLGLGIVLYPLRVNNLVAPTRPLPEGKLRFELRQPGVFGGRISAFARPSVDIYPVLIDPSPRKDEPVFGYGDLRAAVGLDQSLGRVYGAVSHNLQVAYPFSYIGPPITLLNRVVISYPEVQVHLDLRDNRTSPRKGAFFGASFQLAGLGGDAVDFKVQPEARGYLPLGKRVVLAARAGLGYLFPANYGDVVSGRAKSLDPSVSTLDYQLVYFRGLFSGGPNSNRGYPARGVSPYADVPFLTPESAQARIDSNCGNDCRVPTGGFSLWEASVELRVDVTGPLALATFCDASDVSAKVGDLRLAHLHLSCGLGARYQTPVGPIRLDAGYRIPGLQVLGGLTPDEKAPTTLFGAPIAIALGVGEAF